MSIRPSVKSIEGNLLYIDEGGNLVLDTIGKITGQIQSGVPPQFLVRGGTVGDGLTLTDGDDDTIAGVTSIAITGARVGGESPDATLTIPVGFPIGASPTLTSAYLVSVPGDLSLIGDSATMETASFSSASSHGAVNNFTRAKGSSTSPTAIDVNNLIGKTQYFGYDGSSFIAAATDTVTAAEGFSGSNHAVSRSWFTTALDETNIARLGIDANGLVNFNAGGVLKPAQGPGTAIAVSGAATLNTQNGRITSEALTGATTYTLTLTNSVILSTSTVMVNLIDSAHGAVALTNKTVTSGQVVVVMTMSALTGTVLVDFAVFN